MNIVFVLNGKMKQAPDSGGDRHTTGLARYCLDQGDQVRILAPEGTMALSGETLKGAEWILTETGALPDKFTRLDIIPLLFKYLLRTIRGSRINTKPCDIIYCGSILPHEVLCASSWKRRKLAQTLVCRSDQIFHNEPFREAWQYSIHRIASRIGMNTVLKNGALVIAVNDRIAEQWAKAPNTSGNKPRVETLPYGVNQDWMNYRKPTREFDITFFARLDRVKGADLVPSILEELHKRNCPVKINIIGDGLLRKSIQKELRAKGLQNQVTWQGALDGEERFEQLSKARILLYPTREDGFPMAIVEAMTMGLVVVASDNPQLKSAFGDTLLYGAADNPGNMADQIETVLNSKSLEQDYVQRGTSFVRNLPPLGNFKNYRSLMLDVIKG